MRIGIVLAIALTGCVHGSAVQPEKAAGAPLHLLLATNYPGLRDAFERAVARQLSDVSNRIVVLETSAGPSYFTATYTLEASICLDCDQQPAPEGYSIQIERDNKVLASWHRTNVGCSEWECVTARAARDLVNRLNRIGAAPN